MIIPRQAAAAGRTRHALTRFSLVLGTYALLAPAAAAAQGSGLVLTIAGPSGDTLRSATPTFVVTAQGASAADPVVAVSVQLSRRIDFAEVLYEESAPGSAAEITVDRVLPEATPVFWRASAQLSSGAEAFSQPTGPRVTARWVELIFPGPAGSIVQSTRPTFVWRAAQVATPPGPWFYDLAIIDPSNRVIEVRSLTDTTFTPLTELEANTSYRWSVTARLSTGEARRVESGATFVIVSPTEPLSTLLYQNFPNPFPNAQTHATCIWLDVRALTPVFLEVYDLRGNLVRHILPGERSSSFLPAGRYGRAAPGSGTSCDERFSWDGTTDGGTVVPPGVYLLRLRADGTNQVRKIVFRGR